MEVASRPTHVAVIMDGNGRWAQKCGKSRIIGHIAGAKKVPAVAKHLFKSGVKVVSLYAFSEENFARPADEVSGILARIAEFINGFKAQFGEEVRLVFSGNIEAVGEELSRLCEEAVLSTQNNGPFTLNIMLGYGGRTEILRAARLLSGQEITDQSFRKALYVPDLPDPDLIIRTGGEMRLSGFMPYQSAYAELYFSKVLFPDITEDDLDAALCDYSGRNRRFGGV
jgi:undecaprenyl diphosphate synthase